MSIFNYIIAGSPERPTRFHDCRGHFVGPRGLLDFPQAFVTMLLRRAFSLRPELPWIPYPAIREFERIIRPNWEMIEFGSGMSTLWFAQRVKHIVSIESDKKWYKQIEGKLSQSKTLSDRVHYECRSLETYCDVSTYSDGQFDFAVVDGDSRADCTRAVIPKIKKGGWIYFDNSDFSGPRYDGAEQIILEEVRNRNGSVQYFTGFAPTLCFAQQSLLARL